MREHKVVKSLWISCFFPLSCWNKPSKMVGWVGMSRGALQDIIISSSVCWLKMNWNLSYTASGKRQRREMISDFSTAVDPPSWTSSSRTTTMTHLHIIWIRDVREGYKKLHSYPSGDDDDDEDMLEAFFVINFLRKFFLVWCTLLMISDIFLFKAVNALLLCESWRRRLHSC